METEAPLARAHLGAAGLDASDGCPRWSGPPHSGQAETLWVFQGIQVTPGQSTILMTPGGKASWSRGKAGPGLEGMGRSVNGEAMLFVLPQSKASMRQRRGQLLRDPRVRGGGHRLAVLEGKVRIWPVLKHKGAVRFPSQGVQHHWTQRGDSSPF